MEDMREMTKEQLAESLAKAQRKIAELEGQVAERRPAIPQGADVEGAVLDLLQDTLFVFDPSSGKAIRWNEAFRKISGYSDAEIASTKAPDAYYSAEDLTRAAAATQSVVSGAPTTVVLDLITKDGRRIPTEYVGVAVPAAEGTPPLVVSIGRSIQSRVEGERTLQESERRYRLLTENIPTVVWACTEDGGFSYISPNVENAYDYSADELIGAGAGFWFDRIHPEDKDRVRTAFRKLFSEGARYDVEYRIQRKDGAWIWLHDRANMVAGEGGITRAYGVFSDVTQAKRSDQALRESEYWLKQAQSMAKTGLWRLDPESGEITGSDELFRVFGLNRKGATLDALVDVAHPADREHALSHIRRGIEHGESWDIEHRLICRDGAQKVIHTIGTPILDDEGQTTELVGTVQDITERKQLEEALRESEEKFRTLSESSPMGIFLTDKDGGVLYLNDRWCAFAGMAREDALGFGWVEALHPDDKPRVLADWQSCLEKKKGYAGEFRFVQSTGDTRLLYTQTAPIISSSGEVVGHVGANEDITERRQLEAQLRQAEKMDAIGQLAGGIAHDFNNQLVGILGYAEMLREEAGSNPTLTRYADNILLAVKRSSDLTAQLLAFSRKGKYLTTTVDLHRVVFEVVSLLKHSIDKRISIQQQLKANPSTTVGDPTQLQSAVLNLALNARDVMPDGGELVFATDVVELDEEYCSTVPYDVTPGSYLQVSVADTGTGMDEQTRARIFEPFFTTKEPGKGTGMGLAAVYGTIKNHKGSITVYSEPGHGSTFRLYLPLVSESSVAPDATRRPAERVEGGGHVLLVEDDEMVRDVGRQMLETLGYTVTTRADGAQALEHYEKEWRSIDLVILDMVMPVMGGKEAFIGMRKINPDIVALLSSGFSIDGEPQNIIDEGVKGFIQKPFRRGELAQKVMEVFGAK